MNDVLTAEAKAINFTPEAEPLASYNMQHHLAENTNTGNYKDTSTLWVLDSKGAITPKTVTLGASDGVNIQIISGINEGEKLVYSLKGVSKAEASASGTNESPFMPQRPGGKKK